MKKVLIGIILGCSMSPTFAQDLELDQNGWVAGSGFGSTKLSITPRHQTGAESFNKSAKIFTVFGGYNFSNWFGIEFDLSRSADITDENTRLDAYIIDTSFTPKFSYHVDNNFSFYLKTGLQYISYEQLQDSQQHKGKIKFDGVNLFLGTGLQYSFESGVRARIEYKYSKLSLERSENTAFRLKFYDEEIDLKVSTISLTASYQF